MKGLGDEVGSCLISSRIPWFPRVCVLVGLAGDPHQTESGNSARLKQKNKRTSDAWAWGLEGAECFGGVEGKHPIFRLKADHELSRQGWV